MAFNQTHTIGAAHFARAIVFNCDEDCFVMLYVQCSGAPASALHITMPDLAPPEIGQIPNQLFDTNVDLSSSGYRLVAALPCPANCTMEARTFGIQDVDVTVSAVTSATATVSCNTIR